MQKIYLIAMAISFALIVGGICYWTNSGTVAAVIVLILLAAGFILNKLLYKFWEFWYRD